MANAAALQPVEPSRLAAAVLSVAMHLLLFVVLVVGVSWQSRAPEAVSVELWQPAPEPVVEPPPEVKPEPKPEPQPAPPPPEVKPAPPPPKPDIVLEKEKKNPKKEEPKKAPRLNLDLSTQIREQAQRELESVQQEREKRDALATFKPAPRLPTPTTSTATPTSGPTSADASYIASVRSKIRALITVPPDIRGNPEAVFDVEQLPTGDVINVKLRVSSGNAAYDDAIDRAIRKASPLPRPRPPAVPARRLELKFRPLDR